MGAAKSLPPGTLSYIWQCKQPKQRGWEPLRRVKDHPILALLVGLFVFLLPIGAGLVVTPNAKDWVVILVAALSGTWPDMRPRQDVGSLIGVAVGVSTFAVLGIPTLLGAAVTLMLEKVERRITMDLLRYMKARDRFITTEIYREFRDHIPGENADERHERCRDMARAAVRRAEEAWNKTMDKRLHDFLRHLEMPDPENP